MPEWFDKKNIFFFMSMMSDFKKKAQLLEMPLNTPLKPDPIKQNIFTGKISKALLRYTQKHPVELIALESMSIIKRALYFPRPSINIYTQLRLVSRNQ